MRGPHDASDSFRDAGTAEPVALPYRRRVEQHPSGPSMNVELAHEFAQKPHSSRCSSAASAEQVQRPAHSSASYGLTISASASSRDAPANCDRHENARLVVAPRDELLRDQIHPSCRLLTKQNSAARRYS